MCIWCKLPPWIREKLICFFGIIPSQSCTCEVFYGLIDWSSSLHMYLLAHQATDWFVQGKEVKCHSWRYQTDLHMASLSAMMVPIQNSVVFCCKTFHVFIIVLGSVFTWVLRSSSCFGVVFRSSFPENLATLSRRFVLQTFFSDMLSLKHRGTNRSWISGSYNGWNFPKNYNIGLYVTR